MDVNASPRLFLCRRMAPTMAWHGLSLEHLARDIRVNAGPIHLRIQGAIDGEDRVTNFLRAEAAHVEPPEEVVRWIRAQSAGVAARGHPVSIRAHDEPVERLQFPAAGDKLRGQPVKELRMTGPV